MTRSWPASLLLAYPPDWRARYGDELELLVRDLREHGRNPVPMAFDLLRGAAAAWCGTRRGFVMSERSRQALITVLWSWAAFAATAAWFGHDLGVYPTRGIAQKIAAAHQVVPDAYHVLFGVGVVGIAATVVAAVPFVLEAGRYARSNRRNSIFALMAVPPVTAASWLGGVQLVGRANSTSDLTFLRVQQDNLADRHERGRRGHRGDAGWHRRDDRLGPGVPLQPGSRRGSLRLARRHGDHGRRDSPRGDRPDRR